jgi:hypothetical protein
MQVESFFRDFNITWGEPDQQLTQVFTTQSLIAYSHMLTMISHPSKNINFTYLTAFLDKFCGTEHPRRKIPCPVRPNALGVSTTHVPSFGLT